MPEKGESFWERWQQVRNGLRAVEENDPIELAAQDLRTVRAAKYILEQEDSGYDEDVAELLAQISFEYMIQPEEILVALEIAEDRIAYDQA